jgi:hypothetical protein
VITFKLPRSLKQAEKFIGSIVLIQRGEAIKLNYMKGLLKSITCFTCGNIFRSILEIEYFISVQSEENGFIIERPSEDVKIEIAKVKGLCYGRLY